MKIPKFTSEAETRQFLKENPYFCAKPFYSKEIDQTGQYIWCCHWEGKKLARQEFADYDRSIFHDKKMIPQCNFCYNVEKYSDYSERISDSVYALYHKRDLIEAGNQSMAIRFDNVCNVACRMCNNGNSSLYSKVAGNGKIFEISEEDWQGIKNDLSTVKYMRLYGGETFLSKRLLELLNSDHSIENIQFQTNCTVYKKEIMDKLADINQIDFGLSIDGIGPVNDYTRWPSKWSKVKENVERFFEYKFTFIVNPVMNIYTVYYFDQLIDFFYPYMKDGVDININPIACFIPDWMSMKILPEAALDVIKQKFTSCLQHPIFTDFPLQTDNLTEGLNFIINACDESEYTPEKWQQFKIQTYKWDLIQSMIFEEKLPELHKLIKAY